MVHKDNFILTNGVKIPCIGYGTWQVKDGNEAYESTLMALKAGYIHIDTAFAYGNEASIARAIKDSKIDRKDLFITTKLPAQFKTKEEALAHFNASLENLDTDYIDLYLIHAPWPWNNVGLDCTEGNIEVWKVFIDLYNQGKIRSIGVSNFNIKDLKAIIEATCFVPHVNQIRYFIGNTQDELVKYCKEHNILVEAYSPLATGAILNDPLIQKMAEKYNTTVAKLCIRFCLENQTLPLPKSVHEERIVANLDVNFVISKEDMEVLNAYKIDELYRPLRS